MKKIFLAVLSVVLLSSAAFAQSADTVRERFETFKKQVYSSHYYDYMFILQSITSVMDEYMALRKNNVAEAVQVAPLMKTSVKIADGANSITIADYVRMESMNLNFHSDFDEFEAALEQDLKAANRVPDDFMVGVKIFRHALERMDKDSRMDWVMQNAMTVMDAYNELKKSQPQAVGAMAREFCKPVKTGLGHTVNPAEFIESNAHSIGVGFVEDDLQEFAADMLKYSK